VVIGRDARESSPGLAAALAEGLARAGVAVGDLGLCGTEEVYFATGATGAGGGIMVTASHNPLGDNGLKLVGPGARPLKGAEFDALARRVTRDVGGSASAPPCDGAEGGSSPPAGPAGSLALRPDYAAHVAGLLAAEALGPLRVLVNAGNGTAGAALDAVAAHLAAQGARLDLVRMHHDPDPAFPHGIPNPLIAENRIATAEAVRAAGADMGVAWDGDFDRCFLFDAEGRFVAGEHVVALLARAVLAGEPGATIVHDPRVVYAITETVAEAGGRAHVARTGHAHLKAALRETGAPYGGEMSAHHYFRDFFSCDSGMIPWLKVAGLIGRTGRSLADLVSELRARYPSSGEINFTVADPAAAIERVVDRLAPQAAEVDRLDGASLDFGAWRMNLRASSTEPLLRLNLETRGDPVLLEETTKEIRAMIEG
jgi:phosphomannomutase